MNSDPLNQPDRSLEQNTVVNAAKNIANLLSHAPNGERSELVKALDETLTDAGVVVIDTSGSDDSERRGVHTGLTRTQLIEIITDREDRLRRKRVGLPVIRRGII